MKTPSPKFLILKTYSFAFRQKKTCLGERSLAECLSDEVSSSVYTARPDGDVIPIRGQVPLWYAGSHRFCPLEGLSPESHSGVHTPRPPAFFLLKFAIHAWLLLVIGLTFCQQPKAIALYVKKLN